MNDNSLVEDKNKFFERLFLILDSEAPAFWSDTIGVSTSTISGRWRKGSYPSLINIFKLCRHTEISANWLLFGIGNKYIDKNELNENTESSNAEVRQIATEMIYTMQEKLFALESNVKTVELLKWFSENFSSFDEKKLDMVISFFIYIKNEGHMESLKDFFFLLQGFIDYIKNAS